MLVFLTIGGAGFLLLLVSLLLGEIVGHAGDIAHDIAVDHDLGDHGGVVEHPHGGPSIFNIRMLSCFATGFGGIGAVARYYELSYVVSSLLGAAAGVILAGLLFAVISVLYKQQATSGFSSDDLTGTSGSVDVEVGGVGSPGKVMLHVKGSTLAKTAVSADGSRIQVGAGVKVISVRGDNVVVTTDMEGGKR